MLCYCKRCGRLVNRREERGFTCDRCKYELQIVPEEYLGGESKLFIKPELKEQFIEEYIKSAPEFEQALFDTLDEWHAQSISEELTVLRKGRAYLQENSNRLTCPYCKSTRVSRIGLLSRIVSVEFWGLASSKIGKQWHCDNCGSEF